ncbi:alpha/beta fold hydrolase [Rhodococcoides yunnanense]|uniref:Alpha/beta fold hydrolase n=1 Tax=Rhodococcoides yunnanense TaxID=278209 RepID=A0ABU4BKG0_9NOCA|nr:alpha/beta fold hydrolase [Rhodococcus yunnanensis]MDV6264711.1 alpha/beta fold hydrolase [Rhodococcus yunnanensis]
MNTETAGHTFVDLPGAGLELAADRWSGDAIRHKGIVVLLHGGGQTRHSWRATGERLGRLGWIAYAVDLRGHGDSEWDERGTYGLSAYLGDLLSMVTEIRRRDPGLPVALVGASLGGLISLLATGENPGFAQAVVLVDVVVRVEVTGSGRVRDFMMSAPDGFASLEEASDAIASYNPHRRRTGNLDGLKKNLRLRGDRWHWHWDPRSIQIDYNPTNPELPNGEVAYERSKNAARAITCPVLVVRGMASDVVSDEGVAEMRDLIRQTRVVDVREAGHMVAGDDNDVFTVGLIDFLDASIPDVPR